MDVPTIIQSHNKQLPMKSYAMIAMIIVLTSLSTCKERQQKTKESLADAMEHNLMIGVLDKWYPQSIDTIDGGFLSTFTYDFKPTGDQDKFIVTQARHTWTNAKASLRYPEIGHYKKGARHGFEFLKDVMWDKTYGGFYTLVDKQGKVTGDSSKTAYGNAFGLYALAAYYSSSKDSMALALAKSAFYWLEEGSHDSQRKGYYQHLRSDGTPIKRQPDTPSTSDIGYKDQNSSIHLLEALTELYLVWPDELVRERLNEMLVLIRDTIVTPKGYLTLFFHTDWKPLSFADSTEAIIAKHHYLDHVSFGHDVETAYLLLEASHVLGLKNDTTTIRIAKKMVDHALTNGWDNEVGGFYDEGYYFNDKSGITITHDTKNWWAQAEGLNALLLMANLFPDDEMHYYARFETLWKYVDTYLIDHTYGDWYAGGLDKQPDMKKALKGNIWKGIYHHYRSLDNCIQALRQEQPGTH